MKTIAELQTENARLRGQVSHQQNIIDLLKQCNDDLRVVVRTYKDMAGVRTLRVVR
jgi:hypothetical protein